MFQFYFLSVLANLVGGVTLCSDWLGSRPALAHLSAALCSRYARMITGLGALVAGFAKLFFPVGSPIILGDLFPALVGIILGIALLFEVFKQEAFFPAERSESSQRSEKSPVAYKTALGVLGFAAAILHFFRRSGSPLPPGCREHRRGLGTPRQPAAWPSDRTGWCSPPRCWR